MAFMEIFNLSDQIEFNRVALKTFHSQAENNKVYKSFLNLLGIEIGAINSIKNIPFLPVEFFKTHDIVCSNDPIEQTFLSSGTSGMTQSRHLVNDLSVYEESFSKGFEHFYGPIENFTILALLPGYLERKGSSLIYMVDRMIQKSKSEHSGFYLYNLGELEKKLDLLDDHVENILLIGVSYALIDLVKRRKFRLKNTIVMETGGMKGKRKEMVRQELHQLLSEGFGVEKIHSEYGMTELLSQAYSKGDGIFETPPWMKVYSRDTEDPFHLLPVGKTGGINIIDLANVNSCSFIATQDLGRRLDEQRFEILGRFDHSDIRGCNLMVV
jgi:phenylacetate-coenzyme A ligase PaaK-like adenylate-forming protein